ncbi:ABC transporter transmembrane domain-containing protein [Bartonella quintana]|uniref:ABC transporter, ATP-binding protein n=2 Tax=Bartonella quintana TaxID=803 RepID=A0A0H3M3X3_BARQU|nr:ABC transporter transmembrane domain-containing protein [Bartonella quintana]ETS12861.1 ABC transporter, permease/ATP-binding protein [Bartonella quintana BQ2-D70]ETS19443.1 ABC transporter, permease/ATP-binding protein [Bartonella quintana JK 7]KEC58260.1 ABC transporter, permease/ATP-binding protein [Bartonella quintana JK 19]KEC63877.1 ABC transporter, permease/ATP-binding protein [Bartonella quintana JK 63]KEC65028.1 ABC transporter, permease/ATP-binding protein [Bartonella quintana JK 
MNLFNHSEKSTKSSHTKPSFSSFSTFGPYIIRYSWLILFGFLALSVAALVTLALPVAIRQMLDHGFSSSSHGNINFYFAILFVLALLLALASACRYYCVITLGERIVADLRRDVFTHIIQLSPAFFDQSHSGELVSRLLTDTTQIKLAVGSTASIALRHLIVVIGAIFMMVITNAKLSSLVLLAIPFVAIPLVIFGRKVRTRTRIAQDRIADANALATEQVSAVRTVQAFNVEKQVSARFSQLVERAFQTARASVILRSFFTGFTIFLVFSSVVAVLWIGSRDVLNGTMSGGTLGQFVLYAVLGASTFTQLSELGAELIQALGAAERLAELLQKQPTILAPKVPLPLAQPVQGAIIFDQVDFTYPSRPKEKILRSLSFSVKAGETVAFVGASGAGKSTIFSLILRFYDPNSGQIRFDGTEINSLSLQDLRSSISYVPQDVAIFDGTLRDNITFGSENINEEQIIAAAKTANALEFIQALPKGFDTEVGERGTMLSGGQKQRIGIARAIFKNAPLLLLDEATSALDASSEKLVQEALEGLMQHRTTLVIAHRLATILKADRILVMEKGTLVEEGTHAELIAQNGVYAHLAKLQFSPE